ncbi:MAG: hypothetical protein NXH70_11310 [Hyphomonas sp.]|nr:hypothetical protein [Hyphomonas sp.]
MIDSPLATLANQSLVNDQRQTGENEGGVVTTVRGGDFVTKLTNRREVVGVSVLTDDNRVIADAEGLTAINTLTSDATAIEGNAGSAFDGAATLGDLTITKSYSALLSQQIIENNVEAEVTGDVDFEAFSKGDLVDSTITVDGNSVSATATSGAVANTLNQQADTEMSAGASALLVSRQEAGKYADTLATVGEVDFDLETADVNNSTASISDNTVSANATALTAQNELNVEAGSIAGNQLSALDGTASLGDFAITKGFSTLVSDQTVGDKTGAVLDEEIELDIEIETYRERTDYDFSGSSALMDGNTFAASATAAEATNTLSQTADTVMEAGSSASLASRQMIENERGAQTYATIDDIELEVDIGIGSNEGQDSMGSFSSISENTVQADANGLVARNAVTVEAGSIEGNKRFLDGTLQFKKLEIVKGNTTLVSDQTIEDTVTATISEADMGIDVKDDVSAGQYSDNGSTLLVADNLVEAQATAGSAVNSLSQNASTSMTDSAAAVLASSQEMVRGADVKAELTNFDFDIDVEDDVKEVASTLAIRDNTMQAAATGLTSQNAMRIEAGTEITGNGYATTLTKKRNLLSTVDYTVSNSQLVKGDVEAIVEQNEGEENDLKINIGNDINSASSASISGNIVRALATGASSVNEGELMAGSVDGSGIGAVNQQLVKSKIEAEVDDTFFEIEVGDDSRDQSALSISDNAVVAAATAATASNSVTVEADTTLNGGEGYGAVIMTGKGFFDGFGTGAATLLNEQTSKGKVRVDAKDTDFEVLTDDNSEGVIDVTDNTVLAQARGNIADNSVAMSAGTSIDPSAQGVLASNQTRTGSIKANVEDADFFAVNAADKDREARVLGSTSVEGNLARSSVAANSASNSFNVDAGTKAGDANGIVLNGTTGLGLLGANAQYAVLNAQNTSANLVSKVSNADFRVSGRMLDGTASLTGNTVLADATGNSAQNVMNITAGIDSYGSASLINVQNQTGDITSIVRGVDMTVKFTSPFDGAASTFRNSGNTVAATAVGNSAVNTLNRGR